MNLFEYTYNLVRQIPAHKVSSYGAVAVALGDRIASRAVGFMMNQNPDADSMPCFRIVHSDGRLGGFGLGIEDKIRRLKQDGIQVREGKIVDFSSVFFNSFVSEFPLRRLQEEQRQLSTTINIHDEYGDVETIAGVDVAYPENAFQDACGAYVLMDYQTLEVIEETTVFTKTFFPYVPTYFAYRELPVIAELLKQIRHPPSILLCDGHGVLHPRGCGLASHVGIQCEYPTVGVAKTPYSSALNPEYALSVSSSKHPLYVSPGHRVSLQTCRDIVRRLCTTKYPEPLRRAHILAKTRLHQPW